MPISAAVNNPFANTQLCQILIETTNSEISKNLEDNITNKNDMLNKYQANHDNYILKRRHSWSKRDTIEELNISKNRLSQYLNAENYDPTLKPPSNGVNISYSCTDQIHSIKDIRITTKSPWDILCKLLNCKVAFKKHHNGKKYNWIQLAGHAGRFIPGDREGFILKLLDHSERNCLLQLQLDALASFVPKTDNIIFNNQDKKHYMELQDLLYKFSNPSIMDIKIGTRTFLENDSDEKECKPRKDLYLKLIEIAPNEPSAEEHLSKAITKKRYMSWRERSSCSSNLGFRIEAIKKNQVSEREFYTVKENSQVLGHFKSYTSNNKNIMEMYLRRLIALECELKKSKFFASHEMIGSSLLFVHDNHFANIWMIDFGKTRPLPPGVQINHLKKYVEGNHEDGFLFGIANLIRIFQEAIYD